jgi:hypothetical protein
MYLIIGGVFGQGVFTQKAGCPDGTNFRPLGESFKNVYFLKLHKRPKFWGYFFPRQKLQVYFEKKWVGLRFRRIFHKLIWSPCRTVLLKQYRLF